MKHFILITKHTINLIFTFKPGRFMLNYYSCNFLVKFVPVFLLQSFVLTKKWSMWYLSDVQTIPKPLKTSEALQTAVVKLNTQFPLLTITQPSGTCISYLHSPRVQGMADQKDQEELLDHRRTEHKPPSSDLQSRGRSRSSQGHDPQVCCPMCVWCWTPSKVKKEEDNATSTDTTFPKNGY